MQCDIDTDLEREKTPGGKTKNLNERTVQSQAPQKQSRKANAKGHLPMKRKWTAQLWLVNHT